MTAEILCLPYLPSGVFSEISAIFHRVKSSNKIINSPSDEPRHLPKDAKILLSRLSRLHRRRTAYEQGRGRCRRSKGYFPRCDEGANEASFRTPSGKWPSESGKNKNAACPRLDWILWMVVRNCCFSSFPSTVDSGRIGNHGHLLIQIQAS